MKRSGTGSTQPWTNLIKSSRLIQIYTYMHAPKHVYYEENSSRLPTHSPLFSMCSVFRNFSLDPTSGDIFPVVESKQAAHPSAKVSLSFFFLTQHTVNHAAEHVYYKSGPEVKSCFYLFFHFISAFCLICTTWFELKPRPLCPACLWFLRAAFYEEKTNSRSTISCYWIWTFTGIVIPHPNWSQQISSWPCCFVPNDFKAAKMSLLGQIQKDKWQLTNK